MKSLTALIVLGPLCLVAAQPAAAGLRIATDSPIQVVDGTWASDRDSYAQKVGDEMREWKQKLQTFMESAEAEGKAGSAAAATGLNAAWAKTEAEAQKLQTASAEGWESAKAAYEQASHELSDLWARNRPNNP